MKSNMKKIVALSLVLVLIVTSFSACGTKPSDTATADPAATDAGTNGGSNNGSAKEKATLDDLGGLQIQIGDWFSPEKPDTTSSQYAEDTEAYRQKIQKEHNFTITRKNVAAWGAIQEKFTSEVVANKPSSQLWYLYQEQVAQPLLNKLFYNLKSLDTIDLKETKWNQTVTDIMTVGDGIYGMNTEAEPRAGIFFNKKLFKDAGIDPQEPYTLQKSGQWTWDKLEEYCKKLTRDTNNDGKTDVYAMASFSKDYFKLFAATNNANFVGRDDKGNFTNETGTPQFLEAMQEGVKLIKDGYVEKTPEGAAWDWFIAAFRDGECAMQVAETYEISNFGKMQDDFGFVMFPKGRAQGAEMKTVPMDNIVVMPSCLNADEARKVAYAYDLYTNETPGYENQETWQYTYTPNYRDTESVTETMEMMRDSKYKTISYQPFITGTNYGDIAYAIYELAETPEEKIQKVTPVWNKYIDDANKKFAAQ